MGYMAAKENFSNIQSNKIIVLPNINSGQTSDRSDIKTIKQEDKTLKYDGKKLGQRADGRWEIKLNLNGKYKSIYGRTQKDCISNYKKAKENSNSEITETLLFGNWATTWLNYYKTKDKHNAEVMLRIHILPYLKNRQLAELKQIDLLNVINNIKSSRTSIYVYQTLKQIITTAFINDLIPKDITLGLKRPEYNKQNGRALSIEEQENFVKNLKGDKLELYYLFVLYSGTRKSEAYNLQWEDIDFKNETILIRGTKTKESFRKIPLFKKIRLMLEPIKKESGRVFPVRNSTYITKHIKEYGNFRIHDLRHTFTTNAIEAGVPMKVVQHWLGHSNYNTTADIYTHLRDTTNNDFAKLLE